MTKQIYSGYRINLQAYELGIPAIPQTIKGASGDIVQSLREGPVNFALDELNRLLISNGASSGGGDIIIPLASIATEAVSGSGNWELDADTTIAVGTRLIIESGITFVIPLGSTLTVNGTLQVALGGTVTTLGTLINNSNQTVQVDPFATFEIDGGTCINNGTFANSGRFDVLNGGSLEVAQGSILTNEGDIYVVGNSSAISSITVAAGSTIQNGGVLLIDLSAEMQVAAGSTVQNTGDFNVGGDVNIEAGSTFINTGNLNASSETNITGAITGNGTINNSAEIDSPPTCGDRDIAQPMDGDLTIEICQIFTVDPGDTFTIPEGFTLKNNGIMTVCGTLVINGAFVNNAYVNFDLSGAICKIYKDSQEATGKFINNGTCINKGTFYVYDDGSINNTGNINNTAGYIYRGASGGECGVGTITGSIQGRQPQVGCQLVLPVNYQSTDATPITFPYTVPNGPTTIRFEFIGGGGGGGGGSATAGGRGAGAGAYMITPTPLSTQAGDIITFTKGVGGESGPVGFNGTATTLSYYSKAANITYTIVAGGGTGGGLTGSGTGGTYSLNNFTGITAAFGANGSEMDGNNGGDGGQPPISHGAGGNGGAANQAGFPGQNGYWLFRLSTTELDNSIGEL